MAMRHYRMNPAMRIAEQKWRQEHEMLNLAGMTQGDAQHTLQVYQWITEHLPEITARASNAERAGVSAHDMQPTFHETYTELECTRFLPVTIALFTDEDTLAMRKSTEPNVLLYRPDNRHDPVIADYFHTLELSEVTERFGIDGDCQTWRVKGGQQ
ncbi:MAG: hypothetical protein E6J34_23610 [Chloroflexi bacterium]|nr:MAG: hypothetical protein E6J34_23610 [Chloroflexota bacterium]